MWLQSVIAILSAPRTGKLIQLYKITMAQSTRPKASALGNSSVDKDLDDNLSYHDGSSRSSRKDSPFTSLRGQVTDSEYHSSIVNHDFGLFYPFLSIKSP